MPAPPGQPRRPVRRTGTGARPCSRNFAGWTLPLGPGGESVPGLRPAGRAKAGEQERTGARPGAWECSGSAGPYCYPSALALLTLVVVDPSCFPGVTARAEA